MRITVGKLLTLWILLMTASCSNTAITTYQAESPAMDIREYFNGPIEAWGFVQDWKGEVIQRFDITMNGSWDGDTGTLEEEFRYYSGRVDYRTWTLIRLDDGRFEGTAGDVIGAAEGYMAGNAVNMTYKLEIPRGDGTLTLNMDDWMWLMNDGVVINKTKMKKFGLKVGEVTVFMRKPNNG